jgi:hypothetical protein
MGSGVGKRLRAVHEALGAVDIPAQLDEVLAELDTLGDHLDHLHADMLALRDGLNAPRPSWCHLSAEEWSKRWDETREG